ncbi:ST3 beta-galactoside alpha-23-sialyltransferase 3 [Cricetulus griseus]
MKATALLHTFKEWGKAFLTLISTRIRPCQLLLTGAGFQASLCGHVAGGVTSVLLTQADVNCLVLGLALHLFGPQESTCDARYPLPGLLRGGTVSHFIQKLPACRASHKVRKLFRGSLQTRLRFSPDDCHLPQVQDPHVGSSAARGEQKLLKARSVEKGPRVTAFHKWPELEERRGLRHRFSQWRFSKPAPMFLDDSFRKWARIREFVPPFGIKGQDNLIKAILSVTKEYRLTPALDSLHCRRCIIVGNGGVLANKSLGSRIDDYDIVVRLNSAPVKGFERDVGSKTTLRITYPEGAMQRPEQYERDSLFVLAGFKWQDFKWLKYIVYKERVPSSAAQGRMCRPQAIHLPVPNPLPGD